MIEDVLVRRFAVVVSLAAAGCASTTDGPESSVSSSTVADSTPSITAGGGETPGTTLPDVAATTPVPTSAETTAEMPDPAPVFDVVIEDGSFVDETRDRRIPHRTYAPRGISGEVPVILVSHGGRGSDRAYRSGAHLGTTFAANGFLAIHIGHLPSDPGTQRLERPADVTAVLDRLESGTFDLPDPFESTATVDVGRVGHTGHSFGAYTAYAVGGATFDRTFTDDRIDAIAPISPQGADQFAAFDNGSDDNTWNTVTIPAYNLVGGEEVDTNAIGTIDEPGWRLTPFENYPDLGDAFLAVIDGQDHAEMWSEGTASVDAFVAEEILLFMRVYVAGDPTADPCAIGTAPLAVGYDFDRRADPDGSLVGCDP